MLVYKYMVADRIDVLANSRIRFTQPAALNDPFEAYPCFEDFKDAAVELLLTQPFYDSVDADFNIETVGLSEEKKEFLRKVKASQPELFKEYWKNIIKMIMRFVSDNTLEREHSTLIDTNFAILSLSKKRDNPLMWSHYADSHRGFVVGFDVDSPFFKPGDRMSNVGLCDVQYSHDRYVIPKNGLSSLSRQELLQANIGMFFNKSIDWAYEEELRILAHPNRADCTLEVPGGQPICLYNFPVECVREVIFGFRMDGAIIDSIRNICLTKYKGAKLYRSSMHERKFEMEISEFDPDLNISQLRRMAEFCSSPVAKRVLNDQIY